MFALPKNSKSTNFTFFLKIYSEGTNVSNVEALKMFLDFVREIAKPKFQELAILPSHAIIPPLQRFEMAPYKFNRVKLSDAFVFEDDEAVFYVKNEYSWEHDYYVSRYGVYFVTRTSGRPYHAELTEKSFPTSLAYYTTTKYIPTTLDEYIQKKFGVCMTCHTLGAKKSTWKPLHEAEPGDIEEDYIQQGSLELLRVGITDEEWLKLLGLYLNVPEKLNEASRIYNHEFSSADVYQFKNDPGFFFVRVKEDGEIRSNDHGTAKIEKGDYIAFHPVPRDEVD